MKFVFALGSLGLLSGATARSVTVKNNCAYTIWPGLFTGNSATVPSQKTGWEAVPYSSVSFDVPDNWTAGRIWARRDCDFSTNPGPTSCKTGACIGGLECTQPGVPPATLAEFTLGASDGNDYYDVSLVDGFNIPVRVDNSAGCNVADCPVDLDENCPDPLKTDGGCKSSCLANLNGPPSNSPNCCSGDFSTPDKCPSSGVQYYSYFKQNCPNSYAYAYDESSGTALWRCPSSKSADYTITFCP